MGTRGAKSSWAASWKAGATRWCSRRSSAGGARIWDGRAARAPSTCARRSEGSLRRLRTDHIDLYQLHTPDETTPIADTLGALDELVRAGTVREIGCSNFTAAQLREADGAARASAGARFVSVQNELSLLATDDVDDGLSKAARLGMAYIPYFPLANGLLTGKFRRGEPLPAGTRVAGWPVERRDEQLTDATWDRIEELSRFAEERGHSLLDLAFAWLLTKEPVASVIAGATSPEQVVANVAASRWRPPASEIAYP